ncbi:amidohydrolase family protein [Candidatus Micrarchaeota archaeon]|nr:amidohydrolase family protein [Candidatus Micrarchaeota archaeon]
MQAILGKTVYTGEERSLSNCYVVFENGRIADVTSEKPECEVMGEYEMLTPAFVDAHSHIGTIRAGEPEEEEDANDDMDALLFELDVLDSIIMEDTSFRDSVEAGVLYSCVLPGSANVIGGRSVLIRNFADNTRDAFIKYTGLKTAFGYNTKNYENGKGVHAATRMGAVSLLRKMLIKGKKAKTLVEHGKKSVDELEPRMDTVLSILDRQEKLRVHAHKTDDIMAALRLADEFSIDMTIEHASDVYRKGTFDFLKEKGIPVVYGPMDAFPYKVELKHESWRNAEYLIGSGVKFAVMSDHPIVLQRMMLLQMRHFLRLGLTREQCISRLTKYPAEILDADGIGTLAKGKVASVVCWNADPFSLDSYPVAVYAEGKKVV